MLSGIIPGSSSALSTKLTHPRWVDNYGTGHVRLRRVIQLLHIISSSCWRKRAEPFPSEKEMKSRSHFLSFFGIHELIMMLIILRGVVQAFRQGSEPLHPLEATLWSTGTLPTRHRHRWISRRTSPRSTEETKLYVSSEASRTLAPGSHISEIEIKKSRFLGYAKHVENWAEATSYIDQIKEEHPKARHWCYGFQCGVNPITERCSDDGEPTGTAGLPILGR